MMQLTQQQQLIHTVLKVVQKRSRLSPAIRSRVSPLQNFFLSENGEFCCILIGILCDLELQESKQETSYRPGKSKGARSLTLATRPHFKPWIHDSPGEPAPEMSKTPTSYHLTNYCRTSAPLSSHSTCCDSLHHPALIVVLACPYPQPASEFSQIFLFL